MTPSLNPAICAWCANQGYEVCLERCQREGCYRYLAPAPLAPWELPPELPPFRQLMDLPAVERLALLYLAAAYAQRTTEHSA